MTAIPGLNGMSRPDFLLLQSLDALKAHKDPDASAIDAVQRLLGGYTKGAGEEETEIDEELREEEQELLSQLWAQRQALARLFSNLPVPPALLERVGPPSCSPQCLQVTFV